jgi:twitching motility two-component system response regulator PilG
MMTTDQVNYRLFPRLYPLSLLTQLCDRQASGRLSVFAKTDSWSIYLEKGKLIYATSSNKLFERIESHVQQLNQQIDLAISQQMRVVWEQEQENQMLANVGYQVICWLVSQNYLNLTQAAVLIEELAREVLESFLCLKAGSYKFSPDNYLSELPKFCCLDLRLVIAYCQKQLHSQQNVIPALTATEKRVDPQISKLVNFAQTESAGIFLYTVACIDDSSTVLNSIRHFLDESTYSVVMINDPIKALMQIIRSKPDLILLDVEMPNLDGYELCALLRRHSSFKNTPIIMVTGRTGFIDKARAKLVRASGYLTKPFTRSELLKIITKYIG